MSDNTSVAYEAIQKAIVTLLEGAITGHVYDEVPQSITFPYTVVASPTDTRFEARGVKGRGAIFTLRVYTKDSGGKAVAYQIMADIVQRMTAAKLSMTGWKEVWKTFTTSSVEKDAKEPGIMYVGYVNFLIVVNRS